MSHMEAGPASKSCSIFVCARSSILPPAHTTILWPSPVLFVCLGSKFVMSGW